jgi:hypothetical protein
MRRLLLALVPILSAAAEGRARAADAPEPAPARPQEAPPAPADAPRPAPRPRVAVDRTEHDFGPVRQQGAYTTTFTIRNEGDAPLHVQSVRGECGCTQSELSSKEVAPGGTASLTVAFHTYTFVGPLTKHVRVGTDDPDRPTVDLALRVEVAAGIVVAPPNFFFQAALAGSSPTATVRVQYHEKFGAPFRVLGVETAGMTPAGVAVAFDTKPFDAPPWHGYEVTMRFEKPPPIGLVSGSAMIRTDDAQSARVRALVGGSISGRVQVALARPNFGLLAQGKGGHLRIPVRPFDESVDLGEVTAAARSGRVKARVERDAKDPRAWILHLEVPPDAPPGALDDVVELRTSVKGEEVTELPVAGKVLERT